MRVMQDAANGLREAVLKVIEAAASGVPGEAARAALAERTEALPLDRMAQWEQVIRGAVDAYRGAGPVGKHLLRHPGTAWIALCSGSGFDREHALRAVLAGPAATTLWALMLKGWLPRVGRATSEVVPPVSVFVLALAVRRLNDWVPQVRSAARQCLPALATAAGSEKTGEAFRAVLPFWTEWGRLEAVDRQVLDQLLEQPGVADGIRHMVISGTSGPMAELLAQVSRTAVLDAHWNTIARDAIQPAVRARAYRALLMGKVLWLQERRWRWIHKGLYLGRMEAVFGQRHLDVAVPFLEALASAASDRSAYVRREAAEALSREMKALGGTALPIALQLAADPVPSIAQRGRYVLERLEPAG
ncbi:hypothetical protein [Delftia acidovorans]|uniref:hypothetical protein n=1 Tax=Delftia acidovorans TaxID=80866 RepID=UPI00241D7026|nr:hypothetical protein [Delftia acidovorans]